MDWTLVLTAVSLAIALAGLLGGYILANRHAHLIAVRDDVLRDFRASATRVVDLVPLLWRDMATLEVEMSHILSYSEQRGLYSPLLSPLFRAEWALWEKRSGVILKKAAANPSPGLRLLLTLEIGTAYEQLESAIVRERLHRLPYLFDAQRVLLESPGRWAARSTLSSAARRVTGRIHVPVPIVHMVTAELAWRGGSGKVGPEVGGESVVSFEVPSHHYRRFKKESRRAIRWARKGGAATSLQLGLYESVEKLLDLPEEDEA